MWVIPLLFFLMIFAALALCSVSRAYLMDDEVALDKRHEVYIMFGTFTRGVLSMFEITLGNWAPIVRIMHENVGEVIGHVLLFYRLIVGEAIIRVITGVFLVETMKVAQSDDDLMIVQKQRQTRTHIKKMQTLFQETDRSGDGFLDEEEFREVMQDSRVKAWLAAMDLEVRDTDLIFSLIDDGDHKISAEELVLGVGRLKGPARSVDLITLMTEHRRIEEMMSKMCVAFPHILDQPPSQSPKGRGPRIPKFEPLDD